MTSSQPMQVHSSGKFFQMALAGVGKSVGCSRCIVNETGVCASKSNRSTNAPLKWSLLLQARLILYTSLRVCPHRGRPWLEADSPIPRYKLLNVSLSKTLISRDRNLTRIWSNHEETEKWSQM